MAAWALALLLAAPGLDADLERALERSAVKRSGLSVVVGRVDAKAPLYQLAAKTPRIPASNEKVITAAAALHVLGEDFRFQTRLNRAGEDLVVIGDGDPNLSGRLFGGDPNVILLRLAADLKKQGLAKVRDLIVDATRFDDVFVHPDWPKDQLHRWYCAPVGGLVLNDSCWDITVAPSAPGRPARITVQPSLLSPRIDNQCVTGTEHVIDIRRNHDGEILVRGTVRATFTGNLTVKDPVAFFASALRAALEKQGVAMTGEIRRAPAPPSTEPLLVYRSKLETTLPVMLGNSQNLYAECIFKRLGDGTFPGGAKAVLAALQAMGVDTGGMDPKDGSGLAHTNRVTALALYQCLQRWQGSSMFVDALASGGEGTLRRRYRTLGNRIHAKTGTIRGVTTLSGYVTGESGQRYVFVVLANGRAVRNARKLQDLIVMALAHA